MIPKYRRVGLIVPSSNVTMETEIPALLRNREAILSDRFTFHSSRMRMKSVVKLKLNCKLKLICKQLKLICKQLKLIWKQLKLNW